MLDITTNAIYNIITIAIFIHEVKMEFIEFIQDVIANGKDVIVKSLSDTIKVLSDGENEFQLRLIVVENPTQKDIKNCKNGKIVSYQLVKGFDDIYTNFLIYKFRNKNYFFIVRIDDNDMPIFEDYRFTIEDNKVIFSNQPPEADVVKKIHRKYKVLQIKETISMLFLPIFAAGFIYLIIIILSTFINCF